MSISAMSWAFQQAHIPSTPRFVLVAMADFADEAGSCWPSVESLMARTGYSERAVRKALRALEELGAVVTKRRTKLTSRYYLQLGPSCPAKGARGAPLAASASEVDETPFPDSEIDELADEEALKGARGAPSIKGASRADQGGTSCRSKGHHVPPNRHRTTIEPSGGARARGARPTPLPESWVPSEEDREAARAAGLDPDQVLARFRLHFRAKGTRCADWSARWQLWCAEDARPVEAAAPLPQSAPTSPAPVEPPPCLVPEAAEGWAQVHAQLHAEDGTPAYRSWLQDMTLARLEQGVAEIRLRSRFVRDHVRQNHGHRLVHLCRAAGLEVDTVEWVAVPQGATA